MAWEIKKRKRHSDGFGGLSNRLLVCRTAVECVYNALGVHFLQCRGESLLLVGCITTKRDSSKCQTVGCSCDLNCSAYYSGTWHVHDLFNTLKHSSTCSIVRIWCSQWLACRNVFLCLR